MKPFLLFLCCLASLQAMALDLTPRFVSRFVNGQSQQIPTFVDGETRYTVTIPRGVTAAAAGLGETAFYIHENPNASIVWKASPLSPPPPFEEASMAAYRKLALESAPSGATEIAIQDEAANPLPFSDWSSHRYTLAYKLPGQSFLQTVTFVNISPRQQIIVIAKAPAARFEQVAGISWSLLRSWRILPAEENLAVPPPL